ncbi:hypothetical protein LR48_Vigan358s000300 [Vigna angularis]|uniref:RING-type E3 ubiquitin transferase n=2 Tax=Phaseolus angularis TaxID=3914 RepID=A0A0L9T8U2_PHAAN|nr:hypothetical protein LR48_Vigan358s000300 [Vigna angularis]
MMASVLLLQRHSLLMKLSLILILIRSGSAHNECDGENLSCGPYQPLIRFPFQLVNETKEPCSYPRLCLSCTEENEIMLLLPTGKLQVNYIDYEDQEISLTDPEHCFFNKFMQIIKFVQSYQFELHNLSFFNCTSAGDRLFRNRDLSYYQDLVSCPIFIFDSLDSVLELDLTSCTKMFDILSPIGSTYRSPLHLKWFKPNCSECEAKGKRCKWKTNNDTEGDIECFECTRKRIHVPKSLIFATTGSIFLGLVVTAVFKSIVYFREKQEDQARVDKFLDDYRAEKPARFTYADLKRITNGFKEMLGEGAHGAVFRGKLSSEIPVAVKILNNTEGE